MRASRPWKVVVRKVEFESAISFFDARASGPQLSDVRTVIFELRFLPYGDARSDGIPHRPDNWLIFPFLELGKKLETDRVLGGVRTCCRNVWTDASWHRNFSIQYGVRTDDAGMSSVRTGWHVIRTDGIVNRWASRRDGSIVWMADRELEFLLTCRLWIVESLFTASLHLSDFVQTQNEAKILTILPIFVSKGQRVNRVSKNYKNTPLMSQEDKGKQSI
jgi:hypothetical protein